MPANECAHKSHSLSTGGHVHTQPPLRTLQSKVKELIQGSGAVPAICRRSRPSDAAMSSVHNWQDLRRRKELAMLSAYSGGLLQPSTFVPTTQLPLIVSGSGAHLSEGTERAAVTVPRQVGG